METDFQLNKVATSENVAKQGHCPMNIAKVLRLLLVFSALVFLFNLVNRDLACRSRKTPIFGGCTDLPIPRGVDILDSKELPQGVTSFRAQPLFQLTGLTGLLLPRADTRKSNRRCARLLRVFSSARSLELPNTTHNPRGSSSHSLSLLQIPTSETPQSMLLIDAAFEVVSMANPESQERPASFS